MSVSCVFPLLSHFLHLNTEVAQPQSVHHLCVKYIDTRLFSLEMGLQMWIFTIPLIR